MTLFPRTLLLLWVLVLPACEQPGAPGNVPVELARAALGDQALAVHSL